MEMPWSSLLRLPVTAYSNRHFIQHWWKKLLVAIEKGETNIVVMGRPEVGKTLLKDELVGEINTIGWVQPGTSLKVESGAVKFDDWTKLLRVIPGQTSADRSIGINEVFYEHEGLEGLLYVVDWGFTNDRSSIAIKLKIEDEGIDTIEKLRKFNLESELEDFRIVCSHVINARAKGRGPRWMMVLVNKVDLFWETTEDAQSYYDLGSNSSFAKIWRDTIAAVGQQNLKCATLPVCAWEENFGWNNQTITTHLGGSANKRALLKVLVNKIADLSKS